MNVQSDSDDSDLDPNERANRQMMLSHAGQMQHQGTMLEDRVGSTKEPCWKIGQMQHQGTMLEDRVGGRGSTMEDLSAVVGRVAGG